MNDYDRTPQDVYAWWHGKDEQIKKAYQDSVAYSLSHHGTRYKVSPEYYYFHYRFFVQRLSWSEHEAKRLIYRAYPTPIISQCVCGDFFVWKSWLRVTIGGDVVDVALDVPDLLVGTFKYFCSRECQRSKEEAREEQRRMLAQSEKESKRRAMEQLSLARDDVPF